MAAYDDALFRSQFPEFSDQTKYPPALVSMYWSMAVDFISVSDSPCNALNGNSLALALNQLTAHLLVIGIQAQVASAGGAAGIASNQGGFDLSATIGEISVAKLAPPAKDAWGYWLSQTPYGQALWALLELKAVGGFALPGLPESAGFRRIGGVFL